MNINQSSSWVSSLEEIVASITENFTNDEAQDDIVALEFVTWKEALKISITLHNFLLQYENSSPKLLDAIKKIRDEIQVNLNFKEKTIINSYFKKM